MFPFPPGGQRRTWGGSRRGGMYNTYCWRLYPLSITEDYNSFYSLFFCIVVNKVVESRTRKTISSHSDLHIIQEFSYQAEQCRFSFYFPLFNAAIFASSLYSVSSALTILLTTSSSSISGALSYASSVAHTLFVFHPVHASSFSHRRPW